MTLQPRSGLFQSPFGNNRLSAAGAKPTRERRVIAQALDRCAHRGRMAVHQQGRSPRR